MKRFTLLKIISIVVSLISLTACRMNGDYMEKPIPDKNPVFLSADPSTYKLYVKSMKSMQPISSDLTSSKSEGSERPIWQRLSNEWIDIFFQRANGKDQTLIITVKENDSHNSRTVKFDVTYKGVSTPLKITQDGK